MASSYEPVECAVLRRTLDQLAAARDVHALGSALDSGLRNELSGIAARLAAHPDDEWASGLIARARLLLAPLVDDQRVYDVPGEGWGAPPIAYSTTIAELTRQALRELGQSG